MQRGSSDWWLEVLNKASQLTLVSPAYAYLRQGIPEERIRNGWLGFPGASEREIRTIEERLGRELPWSYRQLLSASNGFIRLAPSIGRLLSTSEADLYARRQPELVRIL